MTPDVETTGPDEHGSSYAYLAGGSITRTVSLSDVLNVDIDTTGRIVGIEALGNRDWRDALVLMAMNGDIRYKP